MKIPVIPDLLSLLSAKEKRNLSILSIFMIISALLEVTVIASIAPMIAVITNPDSIQSMPILGDLLQNHDLTGEGKQLPLIFGGFVLLIITISNATILATNYLSLRYSNNREHSIGLKLLKTYLNQSYIFFIDSNSTTLLRNTYNEIAYITSNIISRFLTILSRSISALTIVAFLFYTNPQVTLIIITILAGAYISIYFLIKSKLYSLGRRGVELSEKKLQTIINSLKVFKEIKMQAIENIFLGQFDKAASEYSRVKTWTEIAGIAPKYIIEIFAITALIIAVIYLTATEKNPNNVLPILGVYAFAGFRLMPSLQQIFVCISKIQFSHHSLKLIANEINTLGPKARENMLLPTNTIAYNSNFGLRNTTFSYDDSNPTLEQINIDIQKGRKIALVGKSGEGKSTIIDLLVGLTIPQKGYLYADGKEIFPSDYKGWRHNIAYTSQNTYFLDDTIDMNISLEPNVSKRNKERLQEAKKAAIIDFEKDSSEKIGENGQRLSGGQKQRIGLARTFYQNKPIVVLDEVTSALDSDTESKLLKNISDMDITLIFISHRVETLELFDEIHIISKGEIKESGSFEELKNTSKIFKTLMKSNK